MQMITTESSEYLIKVCPHYFGDIKERTINLGGGRPLRGLNKGVEASWGEDTPGLERNWWKGRGMKAKETAGRGAVPHRQNRGRRDDVTQVQLEPGSH